MVTKIRNQQNNSSAPKHPCKFPSRKEHPCNANRKRAGKRKLLRGEGEGEAGDLGYLGDGGEVVVLDHVAEHDEHGEGEEARSTCHGSTIVPAGRRRAERRKKRRSIDMRQQHAGSAGLAVEEEVEAALGRPWRRWKAALGRPWRRWAAALRPWQR